MECYTHRNNPKAPSMHNRKRQQLDDLKNSGIVRVDVFDKHVLILSGEEFKKLDMIYTDQLSACIGICLMHRDGNGDVDKMMMFHSNSAHGKAELKNIDVALKMKTFDEARNDNQRFVIGINKFLEGVESLDNVSVLLHNTRTEGRFHADTRRISNERDEYSVSEYVKRVFAATHGANTENPQIKISTTEGMPMFFVTARGETNSLMNPDDLEEFSRYMLGSIYEVLDKYVDADEMSNHPIVIQLCEIMTHAVDGEISYIKACNKIEKLLRSTNSSESSMFHNPKPKTEFQKFLKGCQPILTALDSAGVIGSELRKTYTPRE